MSSFDYVPFSSVFRDNVLLLGAHAFNSMCLCVFAAMLAWCPTRFGRAVAAAVMSAILLLASPWIYSSPTQPLHVALASLNMMAAWTMLDWALLQKAAPASLTAVLQSLLTHILSGVAKVHQRRLNMGKAQKDSQQDQQLTASKAISVTSSAQLKQRKPAGSPVIHVTAFTSSALDTQATLQTQPLTATMGAVAESPGKGHCDAITAPKMLSSGLTQALMVLVSLMIGYDVYYTVLCCSSGCMCKGIGIAQMPGHQGLLGKLFSPAVAYYAFSAAAGMLLPMQMSFGYAWTRVGMYLAGGQHKELADSLPRRVFNSPHMATSVTDLWGNRWHAFLRYYFQGLGYKLADITVAPIMPMLPKSLLKLTMFNWRTLVVFAMSGVMHEYLTWAAWGAITGSYMVYFMLHGIALVAETTFAAFFPGATKRVPSWLGWLLTTCFTVLMSPLFIEPYRQRGYFAHTFHPFMYPVTGSILKKAGMCSCSL